MRELVSFEHDLQETHFANARASNARGGISFNELSVASGIHEFDRAVAVRPGRPCFLVTTRGSEGGL